MNGITSTVAFVAASAAYAAACVAYCWFMASGNPRSSSWAARSLGAACAFHAGFLAIDIRHDSASAPWQSCSPT